MNIYTALVTVGTLALAAYYLRDWWRVAYCRVDVFEPTTKATL